MGTIAIYAAVARGNGALAMLVLILLGLRHLPAVPAEREVRLLGTVRVPVTAWPFPAWPFRAWPFSAWPFPAWPFPLALPPVRNPQCPARLAGALPCGRGASTSVRNHTSRSVLLGHSVGPCLRRLLPPTIPRATWASSPDQSTPNEDERAWYCHPGSRWTGRRSGSTP